MRIYIIANDGIALSREAPTALDEGEIVVASNEELHAAVLSGKQLLALWNALPGVAKRKKIGDRAALIDQLWLAIEALPDPEPRPDVNRPSKQDGVIAMLRRPEGATVDEVVQEIEALAAMRGIVAHGPRQRSEIEREIEARSANFYAGFFLRQLNPDMLVLDCGCGTATITIGLAEALPAGTVIGIDLAKDSLAAARRYASVMGRQNLFCAAADGRQLPFPEAAFDAVLCHSVLETAGPGRFYEIRELLWRAAGIAEPNMGRRLRGLFAAGGFSRVEAFADYISY